MRRIVDEELSTARMPEAPEVRKGDLKSLVNWFLEHGPRRTLGSLNQGLHFLLAQNCTSRYQELGPLFCFRVLTSVLEILTIFRTAGREENDLQSLDLGLRKK